MKTLSRRRLGALASIGGLSLALLGVMASPAAAAFEGVCTPDDADSGTCVIDEPEGSNSDTHGTATYELSGDTLTFTFSGTGTIGEIQACVTVNDGQPNPYVPTDANTCAGDSPDRIYAETPGDNPLVLDLTLVPGYTSGDDVYFALHINQTDEGQRTTYIVGGTGGGGGGENPSVSIAKTPDGGQVAPGGTLSFTITVTAVGGTAEDVDIEDTLPAGFDWSESSDDCDINGGVLTCDDVDIEVGSPFSVTVTAPTGDATCTTVNNTASIEDAGQDVTITDGEDGGSIAIGGVCGGSFVPGTPDPDAEAFDCAGPDFSNGVLVRLLNSGTESATFTVTQDGQSVGDAETLTVTPAEGAEELNLPQAEDVATTIVVTSGTYTETFNLEGDCGEVEAVVVTPPAPPAPVVQPTEVAGVQQQRPAALARTGLTSGTTNALALAGALLMLGGLSLAGSSYFAADRKRIG